MKEEAGKVTHGFFCSCYHFLYMIFQEEAITVCMCSDQDLGNQYLSKQKHRFDKMYLIWREVYDATPTACLYEVVFFVVIFNYFITVFKNDISSVYFSKYTRQLREQLSHQLQWLNSGFGAPMSYHATHPSHSVSASPEVPLMLCFPDCCPAGAL